MCNASRQITRQLKEIAELYFGISPLLQYGIMYGTVVKRELYVFERVAPTCTQCSSTLRFAICLQPHLFFVFNVCILCYVYKHQVFIVHTFYFADVFYVIFSPLEVHNFFLPGPKLNACGFVHCMLRKKKE